MAELDWLANFASGAAGGAVALGGQVILQRLAHKREARRRAEERSEQAAREILETVDEARRQFQFHGDQTPLPRYEELSGTVGKIRQASLYIINEDVRGWLDHVADAMAHVPTLATLGFGNPREVTREIQETVHILLGAMLRGERIPGDVGKVERYADAIDQYAEQVVQQLGKMRPEAKPPGEQGDSK